MNILVDGQTLQTPEVNRGIGIYFKNVLNWAVKQSTHTWYLAVADASCVEVLDPWVASRMKIVQSPVFTPCSDFSRNEAFTAEMEKIVAEKKIDLYWCPNPLMVNVLGLTRKLPCALYMMVHDLIPALMPIKEWSEPVRKEYFRRISFLSDEDIHILCNSQATKDDFANYTGKTENFHVTLLAAESRIFYSECCLTDEKAPYRIAFTGGFDYRKNIRGAVEAFAKAYKKYSNDARMHDAVFYIVCTVDEDAKRKFYKEVQQLGIENHVVLTGFISDEELAALYRSSDVFFFPSLYEGFGLPIVEAMLAGTYILSADNSCLPEVCGGYATLCDGKDINDMSEKLYLSLQNSRAEMIDQKRLRQKYALEFSWERTAKQTLTAMEEFPQDIQKRRLAIITPWPDQQTGIANFESKLLPYLTKYFDIDLFIDDTVVKPKQLLPFPDCKMYRIKELDKKASEYDELLYQIGNSMEFHTGIYQALRKYGGIAEIHDFVLHPFFQWAFLQKGDTETYINALEIGYGEAGLRHAKRVSSGLEFPDLENFPMSHSVVKIAKAVIFHNQWSASQVEGDKIYTIPHSCLPMNTYSDEEKRLNLQKLSERICDDKEVIIGCFGFVNANKRPAVVLSAVSKLVQKGLPVKLVYFGKNADAQLEKTIRNLGLQKHVVITGYLDEQEYDAALARTDIVVNLRFPSMGESSGTLCESMKYGKPIIVSDLNQYQEFPDEVCWKVPVEGMEESILEEMLECLVKNPEIRKAMGTNARNYANSVLSPEQIAVQYYRAINAVINGKESNS